MKQQTELTKNPQEAKKTWPNTTWHGRNVHKEVYKLIEDELEPKLTAKGWDFQEVYLAYLDPFSCGDDDNGFIVGYDCWAKNESDESEFFSCYIMFEINNNQDLLNDSNEPLRMINASDVEIDICNAGGFYPHGRKHLKDNWGGLVELRLD